MNTCNLWHISYTALHWAARDGNVEVVELLLKRGAGMSADDTTTVYPTGNRY